MAERIPDEALVVRGGQNRPQDVERGTATHPSGVTGISVESAANVPLEELAAALPHRQIGVTTAGAVRAAGGDVVRTSGRSSNHATLTGLSAEEASRLLTPTVPNPACPWRNAVGLQVAWLVSTAKSLPSVYSTHAVPNRSIAIENVPATDGQATCPTRTNCSLSG